MASVGPNYPSTGVDTGAPTGTWSNISNAFASDSTYATSFVDFGQTTVLRLTNFGITLPTGAVITGIVLETLFKSIGEGEAGSSTGADNIISLVRSGSEVGDNLASVAAGGYAQETPTPVTYGGPSNLWGTTWTKAQIEDSSFGCDLKYDDFFTGNLTAGLDYARITVHYSVPGPAPIVGSGGALGGGTASVAVTRRITGSGGVAIGGSGLNQKYTTATSSGGIVVGGAGKKEDPVYHYPNAPGIIQQISVGGVAFTKASYRTSGSGSIEMAGSALPSASYRFVSDGKSADAPPENAGISVGYLNDLNPTTTSLSFKLNYDFRWRKNQQVALSWDFTWNSGNTRRYWYRIVGVPKENTCPPVQTPDSCCRQYVINIHARSTEDLCDKLRQRNWKWPIQFVQKFSKPADNAAVAEDAANGINYDCNIAEEVEVCQHPACFDFCVDFDIVESWGCSVDGTQTADFSYVADGTIFVGGAANTSHGVNIIQFSYVAQGGIGISGAGETGSSGYTCVAEGGLSLAGRADLRSTHWNYIGGEWPTLTDSNFGTEADQFEEQALDQPWLLPERALHDDGQVTVSDLSFTRRSQFLVIRGFNFNVPENSTILGFTLDVKRYSNSMVKDSEIYLVVGDEIVSDNMAKDSAWPIGSASSGVYGSYFDTWRDSNDPDYLGEWDLDDVNDEEFGVAIRVMPTLTSSGIYAYIESVQLLVSYEVAESQTVRVGGSAFVRSNNYHYVGQGAIGVGGSAGFRVGRRFISLGRSNSGLAGIRIGGNYAQNFHYEATGGLSVGGASESISSHYSYVATGGPSVTGTVDTKSSSYTWVASGGISLESSAVIRAAYRFVNTTGQISVGGSIGQKNAYTYEATGGPEISGTAGVISSNYSWVASGGIAVSGGNDYKFSDYGTLGTNAGAYAEVLALQVVFGQDTSSQPTIVPPQSTLTECNCEGMPLTIPCGHNIIQSNKLSQFASRNNLSIPTRLNLYYSAPNDSWQANYHYKGVSSVSNTLEKWNLLFQLQCTDVVGGVTIGQNVWKFVVYITQQNLSTMQTLETRVVLGFLPDPACASNTGFRVQMQIDTQTQFVALSPLSTVYQMILFDGIGLFKTSFWEVNPNLNITVSQGGLSVFPPRFPLVGV